MNDQAKGRTAIIDIGSNSVRLVVYGGARRAPSILFNEKVMAGLGGELSTTGRIGETAMARAERALARYRMLCGQMGVESVRVVATAAVRDASNGQILTECARRLGLDVEILTGRQEACGAALGIISAFPDASGIVGDLGGGSLELASLLGGEVGETTSLPLGVLRLGALLEDSEANMDRLLDTALKSVRWQAPASCPVLYLVGGSWRSLAKLHMAGAHYPLRLIHGYTFSPRQVQAMVRKIRTEGIQSFAGLSDISSARIPTLRHAAMLLDALVHRLRPDQIVISSHGLREGLLFEALDEDTRREDPLLAATAEAGEEQGRFPMHGRAIDRWLSDLFADESTADKRIRRAACNLGDVAWRANPDFRAERGVEVALHGNWAGIDAAERDMLAQALFTTFGGGSKPYPGGGRLASPERIERAIAWGLAIRLAQRLSGGTRMPLENSRLAMDGAAKLVLALPQDAAALAGEAVEKRLKQLAQRLGVKQALSIIEPVRTEQRAV